MQTVTHLGTLPITYLEVHLHIIISSMQLCFQKLVCNFLFSIFDYVTKYYFCCKNDKKKGSKREEARQNEEEKMISIFQLARQERGERSPLFWLRLKPNLLDTEKSHYELTAAIDFLSPCGSARYFLPSFLSCALYYVTLGPHNFILQVRVQHYQHPMQ